MIWTRLFESFPHFEDCDLCLTRRWGIRFHSDFEADARSIYEVTMANKNPDGIQKEQGSSAGAGNVRSSEIINLSAVELSHAIKDKVVSCVDVMRAYLAQIDRVNPGFNAIVSLRNRDELLKEAAQKDSELSQGRYHGWMHGFPHAVKDLAATKGLPTTMGSPIFEHEIPNHDAVFVERLRKAGAIIIGKTNTPEFGFGSQTYNNVFGTTYNAYDPELCAGGSSGGASVALAKRMIPVADGSDMMGSLRNPAAYNNIIGFRPSFGRVPFGPAMEIFFQQLGYEGPMGRSVKDVAMLLSTMAGFDSRVPLSIREDPHQFAGSLKNAMKGRKIAWLGDLNGYLPMEPGILEMCGRALAHFEDLGCIVEDFTIDYPMEKLWKTWLTLRQWLIAVSLGPIYRKKENRDRIKPEALWEIEGGLKLTASDVYDASVNRSEWYQKVTDLFAQYDYLMLPSAQVFPFSAQMHWPKEVGGKTMDTYHRWMEITIPGTLSGCPIANVPVGFNSRGLPMGMQVMGPAAKDLSVLQLAHAYEQMSGWTEKVPPNTLG
jgi:amidase